MTRDTKDAISGGAMLLAGIAAFIGWRLFRGVSGWIWLVGSIVAIGSLAWFEHKVWYTDEERGQQERERGSPPAGSRRRKGTHGRGRKPQKRTDLRQPEGAAAKPPSAYRELAEELVCDSGWVPTDWDTWASARILRLQEGGSSALADIAAVIQDYRGRDTESVRLRARLCDVMVSIGGRRAADYLKQFSSHQASVGEYELIREAANAGLDRLAPESNSPDRLYARAIKEKDPRIKAAKLLQILERFPNIPGGGGDGATKYGVYFNTAWAWKKSGDDARARYFFAKALLAVEGDISFWSEYTSPAWSVLGIAREDWVSAHKIVDDSEKTKA